MKKYNIQIDVTLSGTIEVTAKTKKEAIEKIIGQYFVPSDLRTFSHIKTSVVR